MAAARYPALRLSPQVYTAEERAVIRRAVKLLDRGLREPRQDMNDHRLAGAYLRAWIGREEVEVFVALWLDSARNLIAATEVARGTLTQTAVYPRELARAALQHNAAAVIVAHNHPSGVDQPSAADHALTRTLQAALRTVDVDLLDHFIVTAGGTLSFASRGWL